MFELVCGNASHAVGRVRVCVSPFGAVTLLTFRLLIGQTQQRSGSIMGFESLSCLHSQFSKATLSLASFLPLGDLCKTIFLSFSLELSYIVNVYIIFTSLIHVCLQSVFLCLTVVFLLMFTSYLLSLLSCFFSLTVLNY